MFDFGASTRRGGDGTQVPVARDLEVLAYHMLSAKHHVRPVDSGLAKCGAFNLDRVERYAHEMTCEEQPG